MKRIILKLEEIIKNKIYCVDAMIDIEETLTISVAKLLALTYDQLASRLEKELSITLDKSK